MNKTKTKFRPPSTSLRPFEEDGSEFALGAIIKWPKLNELDDKYIVDPLSIKNQIKDKKDDACGSCAGSGATEPREEAVLFYPFLFAAAKEASGSDPMDWGLTLKDIGKGLAKYGIPEVKDVTPGLLERLKKKDAWRYFENYPKELKEKALKHRAKSYFFVKGFPKDWDYYDAARAAEWYFKDKLQHVIFGVQFGWPLEQEFLDGVPDGYGHAMWLAGWNERGGRAVNSAGKEAGEQGIHTISRETFNASAKKFGMLMIVDLEREVAEDMLGNGVKIGDNWVIDIIKRLTPSFLKFWI